MHEEENQKNIVCFRGIRVTKKLTVNGFIF